MTSKRTKINAAYGYSLTISENDIVTIIVTDAEGERIEFDGKKGNLMIAGDMEAWFEDEDRNATLATMTEYSTKFLADWGVEEDVAKAIAKDLTPWFERYAISDDEATAKEIAELESWIKGRRDTIARKSKVIDDLNKDIKAIEDRKMSITEDIVNISKSITNFEKQIAELKAKRNKSEFISVEPCYTGGGVYIFTGQLADGNYFMADTSFFDVRIVNEDPDAPTHMDYDGTVSERNIDSVEWQEEHLVEDLNPTETVAFFRQMLKWVQENEPNGNYNMGDMEDITEELDTLKGDWR